MTFNTTEQWKAWNQERERFKNRETQGLQEDIATFRAYIFKLTNIAPKDKAGFPVGHALSIIDDLKKELARYLSWIDVISPKP